MTTRMRLRAIAAGLGLVLGISAAGLAHAAVETEELKDVDWSFEGPLGTFDRAQLQRGFKIYREVCSSCHGLDYIAFRNLADEGGPGFTEDQVEVIAADYAIVDGPDDFGDMFERPGEPKDRFPSPFPNEKAAQAANGGVAPPDLSVIAKARSNGPDYIYSLLTGYEEAPADVDVGSGYYNPYFPGHVIAMAPPLYEDSVEYTDGTPMTVEQYARDVTAFFMWTAEPKLEERKRAGLQVMLFLIVLTVLLYLTKRKIWADVDH